MSQTAKEKFKTFGGVFDNFALRALFKLSSQGYFDNMESLSPVSIGKESNVFSAKRKDGKVIVKIYRLETCDFNRMFDYIKFDPRYVGLKNQRRKVIFSWVQREFRNLMKAREAGVKVPTPLTFSGNILIEEFIGDESPAPKLKDKVPKNMRKFFDEIILNLKKLHAAGLVHADLSHFNILNDSEKPVIIDLSTCTPVDSQMAADYLARDIRNLCNFFAKHGLKISEDEAKARITSYQKV